MAKRVLIVDDSAFMRSVVKDVLTGAGYDVAGEASNGEEALQRYPQLKPDLVTMDIVMLGDGGLQAVKRLIHHDPKAKILMVSAMGQQALVVDAIRAGATGFVVKPFKPEQLLAEITRILN